MLKHKFYDQIFKISFPFIFHKKIDFDILTIQLNNFINSNFKFLHILEQ